MKYTVQYIPKEHFLSLKESWKKLEKGVGRSKLVFATGRHYFLYHISGSEVWEVVDILPLRSQLFILSG